MSELSSLIPRGTSLVDVVIELYVDNENVATTPVSNILRATESTKASYSALCRLAVLSAKLRERRSDVSGLSSDARFAGNLRHIRLCYRDDEGGDIVFSTDVELMEALESVAASNRDDPTLQVHVEVPPSMENAQPFDGIVESETDRSIMENEEEEEEEVVAKEPVNNGPFAFLRHCNKRTSRNPNDAREKWEEHHNNLFSFIARLIQGPNDGAKRGNDRRNQREPHCRPRAVQVRVKPLASETTPILKVAKGAGFKRHATAATVRNVTAIVGTKAVALSQASEGVRFDPRFVHRRHACDGCDRTPIVGRRYHAVNAYNIDLCEACFDLASDLSESTKSTGMAESGRSVETIDDDCVVFQLEQHKTDQSFKRVPLLMRLFRFDRLAEDIIGFIADVASKNGVGKAPSDFQRLEQRTPEQFYWNGWFEEFCDEEPLLAVSDFDLQVAIQKSLRELRRSTSLANLRREADEAFRCNTMIPPAIDEGSWNGLNPLGHVSNAEADQGRNLFSDNQRGDFQDLDDGVSICPEVALTGTDDEGSDTSERLDAVSISDFISSSDLGSSDFVGFNDSDWCAL